MPEIAGAPTGKLWYHGNIKDRAAEQRLKIAADEMEITSYTIIRELAQFTEIIFYLYAVEESCIGGK